MNRNPDNFFAEVEQAAFNPAYPVPGIGPSPDKMLQGRLFNFGDTRQRWVATELAKSRMLLGDQERTNPANLKKRA